MKQLRYIFILLAFSLRFFAAHAENSSTLFLSFEQRQAMSYVLLAEGETDDKKDEVFSRLKTAITKAQAKGMNEIKVRNFAEFLQAFRGDWPGTQSLELDMQLVEQRESRGVPVFKASSARVQKQIDQYIEAQQQQFMEIYGGQEEALVELPTWEAAAMLNPRAVFDQATERMSEAMNELNNVGRLMSETYLSDMKDPAQGLFLRTILNEYFQRLSPASKKLIASSYLGGDLKLTTAQKFEIMVQNSGPQLQKLLQVIARESNLDPTVLEIFKELESSVRPVPWVQVQQLLDGEKDNYQFTYFERKPLGVGTMAQVHRAKMIVGGERADVVVRFIKPGIDLRVQEDHRILTEVAKIIDANPEFAKHDMPRLSPLIEDLTATVTAELSQSDTINRQTIAKMSYDKSYIVKGDGYKNEVDFHVPDLYQPTRPSKLMVQEMVFGRKIDSETLMYEDLMPGLKKEIVEAMARMWSTEILFGRGFYHADLHQGNFMVKVTDEKVIVNILDFGMGGVITSDMQKQILLLGAAMQLNDVALMAKAYWNMSDQAKNTISFDEFMQKMGVHMQEVLRKGKPMNQNQWTSWAMDNGIHLAYDLVNLNRGVIIVDKLLQNSGSNLTVAKIMASEAKASPLKAYQWLVVEQKMPLNSFVRLGFTPPKGVVAKPAAPVAAIPAAAMRCEAVFL